MFAHEYGHDLGLPDHYDTAGGPDNAVNWWTLMAQSRASAAGDEGIGTRPADLGAWDKLQLGWLDYEIVPAGTTRTLDLGPHEYNSAKAQGVVTPLPKKPVVTENGAPFAGTKQWYSGTGDDLDNTLTRQVTLPAGTATLTFQARWNIEDCGPDPCDYAYVEVDDGSGWTAIPGSITKAAEGNGIDGWSDGWKPATFDLSEYAGKTIGLRLALPHRRRRAGQPRPPDEPAGIFADAFKLTSGTTTVFEDGAESGNNGWTPDGFSIVGATTTTLYDHYYIASNRQYVSYDKYLQTGPYNFGWLNSKPDWVEHFPYQNGLLVSYWDTSFSDNNESVHPGRARCCRSTRTRNPIYKLDGHAVAREDPDLRLAVLAREGGLVHAARQRPGELHPRAGRGADVRRPQGVLERGAADRGREGAPRRRADAGGQRERHVDAGPHRLGRAAGRIDPTGIGASYSVRAP